MVREQYYQATATATAKATERRTEPRIKAGLLVLVSRPGAHPAEGCLLNLSPHGARVRVPEMIPVGTPVRIEAHELLLVGNIRRCELTHGAYEAGVMLSVPLETLDELQLLDAALRAEADCV